MKTQHPSDLNGDEYPCSSDDEGSGRRKRVRRTAEKEKKSAVEAG
jgi:hypothetical protein